MNYTTPAYKEAAVGVMLEEANELARQLALPERLPIRRDDLIAVHACAAIWSDSAGWFGNISTRRYVYSASLANRMSSVVRHRGSGKEEAAFWEKLRDKYRATNARPDKAAALKLATQWLEAASIDVSELLRNAHANVHCATNVVGFIPYYIVSFGSVAEVHLLEPERELLDLTVSKPQYLKRRKLVVPNRDWLLQQTDDPKMRQMWLTTDAYKRAALEVLLREASDVSAKLALHQELPLQRADLTEWSLQTPYFSDHLGLFGTLSTPEYVFTARPDKKLAYINRNFRLRDNEATYREELRTRYVRPKAEVNTNAAYRLASGWLNAISVDVEAMERDYHPVISWWELGREFVPLYRVEWRSNPGATGFAAMVELVEPERSLKELWVEKTEYLKRPALTVPHREELLQVPNSAPPPGRPPR